VIKARRVAALLPVLEETLDAFGHARRGARPVKRAAERPEAMTSRRAAA
jgi:hypothetical protein